VTIEKIKEGWDRLFPEWNNDDELKKEFDLLYKDSDCGFRHLTSQEVDELDFIS